MIKIRNSPGDAGEKKISHPMRGTQRAATHQNLTSDGLIDQLGGDKHRSFGKKRFKQLIAGLNDVPLSQHGEKIYETLLSYQGDEKRRDDVSVIGFKI